MADRATQSLYVIFEEGCSHQHLPVGILGHDQGHFTQPLFYIPEVVLGGMVLSLEFRLGVWPRGAGGSLSWFLHQLGAVQSAIEAFLNRVENFLADILCHLHIARLHSRHSFQLIYFIVHPSNFFLGDFQAHELNGRYVHTQVSLE